MTTSTYIALLPEMFHVGNGAFDQFQIGEKRYVVGFFDTTGDLFLDCIDKTHTIRFKNGLEYLYAKAYNENRYDASDKMFEPQRILNYILENYDQAEQLEAE